MACAAPLLYATLAGCAQHPQLAHFEATLAAHDSATLALAHWCAARHIANPAQIIAQPITGADTTPPPGLRDNLGVSASTPLAYRHVALVCGTLVLSQAHNWYVPSRLSPAMNTTLTTTHTPFGTVLAPLAFRRERLASLHGATPPCPANTVLSHTALLRLPNGTPLAQLVECYTPSILLGRDVKE